MKNIANAKKILVTSWERILIELLEGPLQSGVLAERVGLSETHLSRILPRLKENQLILSRFPNVRRINRLTSKGRAIAEAALVKQKVLQWTLPPEEVREGARWVGGLSERGWSPIRMKSKKEEKKGNG